MRRDRFGCRGSQEKAGVLLAQLGTPDAPTAQALRPYLKQFLGDPRVIEANRFKWWLILNGIILRTRPKRSARLYSRIWDSDGSPLLKITERQTAGVRERLAAKHPQIEIEFGMRYGSPSLGSAIDRLISRGVRRLLLVPMYPQYAGATTASTYDEVFTQLLKRRWVPTLKVAAPYYRDQRYLSALATTINDGLARLPAPPERLVFSYHGVPAKQIEQGDPYCCHCTETTELVRPLLAIEPGKVIHTFQSRFGKDPWLTPYTDVMFEELARQGVKRIAVASPAFTADCLETLDEIGNEGRELFMHHGGEDLRLIPSVNDHPAWLDALTAIVVDELGSWAGDCDVRDSQCVACPAKIGGV